MFFIFYKLTIGATIREFEKQISFLKSKENVEFIKDAFRSLSAVVSSAIEDAVDQNDPAKAKSLFLSTQKTLDKLANK